MLVGAPATKLLMPCVQVADDDSALRLKSAAKQLLVKGDAWREIQRADRQRPTSRSDDLHAQQTMTAATLAKHFSLTQARPHQQNDSNTISIVREGVRSVLGPVASPKVGVGGRGQASLLDGDDGR